MGNTSCRLCTRRSHERETAAEPRLRGPSLSPAAGDDIRLNVGEGRPRRHAQLQLDTLLTRQTLLPLQILTDIFSLTNYRSAVGQDAEQSDTLIKIGQLRKAAC